MSQIEKWQVLVPKIIKFLDLFIFAELLAYSPPEGVKTL